MFVYFVKMSNGSEMMSQSFNSYDECKSRMEATLALPYGVKLVSGRIVSTLPTTIPTIKKFPTSIRQRTNGGTIETTKYSKHWGMRILNADGQVIATHSGNNSNIAWKRELLNRYSK